MRYVLLSSVYLFLSFASGTVSAEVPCDEYTTFNQHPTNNPSFSPYYRRHGVYAHSIANTTSECSQQTTPRSWAPLENKDVYRNRAWTGERYDRHQFLVVSPATDDVHEFSVVENALVAVGLSHLIVDSTVNSRSIGGGGGRLNFSVTDTLYFESNSYRSPAEDALNPIGVKVCGRYRSKFPPGTYNGAQMLLSVKSWPRSSWNNDGASESAIMVQPAHREFNEDNDFFCITGALQLIGKRAVYTFRLHGYNRGTLHQVTGLSQSDPSQMFNLRNGSFKIEHKDESHFNTWPELPDEGVIEDPILNLPSGVRCYSSSGNFPGCQLCTYEGDRYGNVSHGYDNPNRLANDMLDRALSEPDVNDRNREYTGAIHPICPVAGLAGQPQQYNSSYKKVDAKIVGSCDDGSLSVLANVQASNGMVGAWHTHPYSPDCGGVVANATFSDKDKDFAIKYRVPLYLGFDGFSLPFFRNWIKKVYIPPDHPSQDREKGEERTCGSTGFNCNDVIRWQ